MHVPAHAILEGEDTPISNKSIQSHSQLSEMLSFKLESLRYQNNYRASPGQTFEQEYVFVNDGTVPWPNDTTFLFSVTHNPLMLPEEISIGEVIEDEVICIQIMISLPKNVKHERYFVEYEFRHHL